MANWHRPPGQVALQSAPCSWRVRVAPARASPGTLSVADLPPPAWPNPHQPPPPPSSSRAPTDMQLPSTPRSYELPASRTGSQAPQPQDLQHRQPMSSQPGRTSPALIAQREKRAKDAQALTVAIRSAAGWRQLEALFIEHRGHMNHIHMSAFMTRLAHLGEPTHHHSPPPTSHPGSHSKHAARGWSKQEVPAVRLFLATAVPYIGLHMLSLGPRQLASIMWALGSLAYTPQPAWMVEWSACVARKLDTFTPQDLAMSTWGLVACGAMRLDASSGAPGVLQQLALAATQPHMCSSLQPRDVSNVCWALATSGTKPSGHVLQALVGRAAQVLQQTAGGAGIHPAYGPGFVVGAAGAAGHGGAGQLHSQVQLLCSFSAAELANVLWAMAKLGFWPGQQLLSSATQGFLSMGLQPPAEAPTPTENPLSAAPVAWQSQIAGPGPLTMAGGIAAANNVVRLQGVSSTALQAEGRSSAASRATPRAPPPPQARHHALVLWALARLRARPSAPQVAALLAGALAPPTSPASISLAARPPQHAMRNADLAQVMWSLGRLQYQPPRPCWQLLLPATISALAATGAEAPADLSGAAVPAPVNRRAKFTLARRQAWRLLRRRNRWLDEAEPEPPLPPQLAALCNGAAGTGMGATAMTGAEVLALLWGLRRLRMPRALRLALRVVVPRALATIAPEVGRLPIKGLLQVAAACAMLHVRPPVVFMKAWAARCAPAVPVLDDRQLAQVLWSLVVMRKRPPPAFLLAARRRAYQLMLPQEGLEGSDATAVAAAAAAAALPAQRRIHQVVAMFPQPAATAGPGALPTSSGEFTVARGGAPGVAVPAAGPAADAIALAEVMAGRAGQLRAPSDRFMWQGSPDALVHVLWALGKLRAGPTGGPWANAAAACAARAVHALRPAELSRLVTSFAALRLRPSRRVAGALSARCRAAAAARAAALGCDAHCGNEEEPCGVEGMEQPCSVPHCTHLKSVPSRLTAWRRALVADELRTNAMARRSYTRDADTIIAPL